MGIISRFIQAFVAVFSPTFNAAKTVYFDYGKHFNYPQTVQQVDSEAVQIAKALLKMREGSSLIVYPDPVKGAAFPTVGIGHLVTAQDKLKIGDKISAEKENEFFEIDIQKSLNTSKANAVELDMYSPKFLAALISVNFQLGSFKSKFPNSYQRLKSKKFDETIAALKQSDWFQQTPKRVNDFISAIEEYRDTIGVSQGNS